MVQTRSYSKDAVMENIRTSREKRMVDIKNNLEKLHLTDINSCGFEYDNHIYVYADVLLHIISFLDIASIQNLMCVSRGFYVLCNTNSVWKRILFGNYVRINNCLFNANRAHFPDKFHFGLYAEIDNFFLVPRNFPEYNYRQLMRNLIDLVGFLKPPYVMAEVRDIVKKYYSGCQIDYTLRIVNKFSRSDSDVHSPVADWDHQLVYRYESCEMIIAFKKELNEDDVSCATIHKIVRPLLVPSNILRQKNVRFYPENVKGLFY